MIEEVIAKKNKYICLLTSPFVHDHDLQHEIINLIYLYIYIYIVSADNKYC